MLHADRRVIADFLDRSDQLCRAECKEISGHDMVVHSRRGTISQTAKYRVAKPDFARLGIVPEQVDGLAVYVIHCHNCTVRGARCKRFFAENASFPKGEFGAAPLTMRFGEVKAEQAADAAYVEGFICKRRVRAATKRRYLRLATALQTRCKG